MGSGGRGFEHSRVCLCLTLTLVSVSHTGETRHVSIQACKNTACVHIKRHTRRVRLELWQALISPSSSIASSYNFPKPLCQPLVCSSSLSCLQFPSTLSCLQFLCQQARRHHRSNHALIHPHVCLSSLLFPSSMSHFGLQQTPSLPTSPPTQLSHCKRQVCC